ncbi:MAG: hypothetical protein KME27_24820 [Lyngbya sp. HA4199-MV5]|jgi:uncharacterized protein YoxC|nr:hypothetical protein [Lyngbya sp. HA4199-MV5]
MTNQTPLDRLDRIEEMLAVLITHTDATDRRINQLTENQLLLQQDISLLVHRVDRLGDRVDQVATTIEAIGQQAEQDRSQAAIDRAEFRSTVQQILEALQASFGGNGHSGS